VHTELQRNIDTLNQLLVLARDIASSHTLQDLIRQAAKAFESMIGTNNYYLALVDEQQTYIRFLMRRRPGEEVNEEVDVRPMGKWRTDYVIRTQQVLRLTSIEALTRLAELDIITSASKPGAFLGVPIIASGRVLGMLGLEDSGPDAAFSDQQERLAAALAGQLGVALENLRLLEQTERTAKELSEVNRRLTGQGWQAYSQISGAVRTIDTAPGVSAENTEATSTVTRAITLRGEVIGEISLQQIDRDRTWTASEVALLQAVANEVAIAADNARLIEETERRAQAERVIAEIGRKLLSANDLPGVVRIASEELGRVLRVARVETTIGGDYLKTETEDLPPANERESL
jgi:GAF domain-containing protein